MKDCLDIKRPLIKNQQILLCGLKRLYSNKNKCVEDQRPNHWICNGRNKAIRVHKYPREHLKDLFERLGTKQKPAQANKMKETDGLK